MGKGIFGGLFDFNRDGKMSAFERASEFAFLHHIMESEEKAKTQQSGSYDFSSSAISTGDDESDDRSLDLMIAGLDEFELSLMDEDDRRAALEDAGLDPLDFTYLEDL